MNPQEEIKTYKQLIEKQMLRNARIMSFILGAAAMVTVVAMIYGFTQSIEASRQNIIRERLDAEIISLTESLRKCESQK